MPRNDNGIYTLPDGYLAVSGETIQPSQHNPPLEDIADALTGSLPRNGSAPMGAQLKLIDGTASAPAWRFNSDAGRGVYKTADGIGFSIGGALAFEIRSTGAVFPGGTWVNLSDIEVQSTSPSYWLHIPSVKRARWLLFGTSLYWQDQSGTNHFSIANTGAVSTQQLGDLKTYIDSTAAAAAAALGSSIAAVAAAANDRVYRVRMAGYGITNGDGPLNDVSPGVFVGAGTVGLASQFAYRALQQNVPALGGWVNISVE